MGDNFSFCLTLLYNSYMQNLERNKLFVISGSSGVGKSTVIRGFLEENQEFVFSVSCTTRPMREGEKDGVNYFYVSKDEFKNSIKNDEFLEWAEFSDNFYGTKREFVQNCFKQNKNLILDIDTQGALQVKQKMPDAVLIFIAPPSYQDLEYRLRSRNTESEEAIAKRLDFVKLEIENSKYYDYIVVNDELHHAISELERIINYEVSQNAQR